MHYMVYSTRILYAVYGIQYTYTVLIVYTWYTYTGEPYF
jgi:hypothetical protein